MFSSAFCLFCLPYKVLVLLSTPSADALLASDATLQFFILTAFATFFLVDHHSSTSPSLRGILIFLTIDVYFFSL